MLNSLPAGKSNQCLTVTETIVYKHLLSGKDCKDIATVLRCSFRTVKFHKTSIYKKTGVKNITGLLYSRIVELESQIQLNKGDSRGY